MTKLENICKSYYKNKQELNVLKSINCNIASGEMVALMGRSGSGKTTLINILSGLLEQSNGNYFFNLENVTKFSMREKDAFREKHIGIIVQNYALLNSMTAFENIALPLRYKKKDNYRPQIEELSEKLSIKNCLDKKVSKLSGGECQRVAIARALIKKPSLILADEPTGSLDSKTEQEVMSLFKQLKNVGNTIVIATHSTFVSSCCDRILKIDDGEIF